MYYEVVYVIHLLPFIRGNSLKMNQSSVFVSLSDQFKTLQSCNPDTHGALIRMYFIVFYCTVLYRIIRYCIYYFVLYYAIL